MTLTDLVAPGIRRIRVPLETRGLPFVNAYLIEGSAGWSLVDVGYHTDEAIGALKAGLAEAGLDLADVRRLFVTHLHGDHIGLAGTFEQAGVDVLMHRPELDAARYVWFGGRQVIDDLHVWFTRHGMPEDIGTQTRENLLHWRERVDPLERVTTVEDGQAVDLAGRQMQVRWTPGHTDYHAVLVDEAESILISGDHVLPRITPNVSLYSYSRDDPLGDFLGALRSLRGIGVKRVLPAHGEPFDDLTGRVDELLEHHEKRLARTLDALGTSQRDAYDVAQRMFPKLVTPQDRRMALGETLAHLRHLERTGSVQEVDGVVARWQVVNAR